MHVLYMHQNFPAQFGPIAVYLLRKLGHRVSFVTSSTENYIHGLDRVHYQSRGGATAKTHFSARTFENAIWHSHGAFDALRARRDLKPDLVVAHSGFLSALPIRELYDCPVISYFEYFYHPHNSDMDFRKELQNTDAELLRAHFRNAILLLDLNNCDIGYAPTHWQRDRLPTEYHRKVRVVFDGIDTQLWKPPIKRPVRPRKAGKISVPDDVKLVTYVSRGFEMMRGFDIFMKLAQRLCDRRSDVRVVLVGSDRICYGGDEKLTGGKSFKEWVLSQGKYDLSRIHFAGTLPPNELAELFGISDLHVYLTAPFVLSWSLMNALACGALVLASNTAPVLEVVEHGRNGLLTDYFDLDAMTEKACRALDAPAEFEPLRQAAVETVRERYSMEVCLPQMLQMYDEALAGRSPGGHFSKPAGAVGSGN